MKILIILAAILILIVLLVLNRQFINCPAGKILIINGYGINSTPNGCEVISGGSKFVLPIIQNYSFLDLSIFKYEFNETLNSKESIPMKVKLNIAYGISNEPTLAQNAAMILNGSTKDEISILSEEIIKNEIRNFIKSKDIVDVVVSRRNNSIENETYDLLNKELNKVGIDIISLNLKSLNDFSNQLSFFEEKYQEMKNKSDFQTKNSKEVSNELKRINQAISETINEQNKLLDLKLKILSEM